MPYTFLETAKRDRSRVYGGKWQTVQGDEASGERLGPGESTTVQLTTDSWDRDPVARLKNYQGRLLWRVQVRRGLVPYKGEEVSTTAVVGVEFDSVAIQQTQTARGRERLPSE
jgi:hypothetical protein